MNEYRAMRDKHQEEVNAFPMFFAFSNQQFEEGMKKLGLKPTDTKQLYKLGGTGGFYRKSDAPALREMFKRHDEEMAAAIAADETGDGFIYDMFDYELANHEFGYTRDIEPALDALELTIEEIRADDRMTHALERACREQIDWYNENN